MIEQLKDHLKDIPPEEWDQHWLCYDNLCNVDRLKFLQDPLPHNEADEKDLSRVWLEVGKCIGAAYY